VRSTWSLIAALSTGVYSVVALACPALTRHLPRSATTAISAVLVRYPDGQRILRDVLEQVTIRGFAVHELSTAKAGNGQMRGDRPGEPPTVEVTVQVHGKGQVNELAAGLSDIPGVRAVAAEDVHAGGE